MQHGIYLSREETVEFTARLRTQCSRRGWSLRKGLEKLGIPKPTYKAWATLGVWGHRMTYEDAFRIAGPLGIKLPKARRVTSHFVWPDGDFEEWVDIQIRQVGNSRSGCQADAGLVASIMGALFSRWSNLELAPKLSLDSDHDGRLVRAKLIAGGASDVMHYALHLDLEKGTLFATLFRLPTSPEAAAPIGRVGGLEVKGASFVMLERRLEMLRDRTTRRKRSRGSQSAQLYSTLEKSIMDLCRLKQTTR